MADDSKALLDWLNEQGVDYIAMDDGGTINVAGLDIRAAVVKFQQDQQKFGLPQYIEDAEDEALK